MHSRSSVRHVTWCFWCIVSCVHSTHIFIRLHIKYAQCVTVVGLVISRSLVQFPAGALWSVLGQGSLFHIASVYPAAKIPSIYKAVLRAFELYAANCSWISLGGMIGFRVYRPARGGRSSEHLWIQDYKPNTFTFIFCLGSSSGAYSLKRKTRQLVVLMYSSLCTRYPYFHAISYTVCTVRDNLEITHHLDWLAGPRAQHGFGFEVLLNDVQEV